MTEYVVGFLFSDRLDAVALIKKTKPEWQRGRHNGIGGKVEPGETFLEAMVREFKEETGALVENWQQFGAFAEDSRDDYVFPWLTFFTARGTVPLISTTEETVVWADVGRSDFSSDAFVPNLAWLIPMARLKLLRPDWKPKERFMFA